MILNTIQSNRALYRDLAMESRAVMACGQRGGVGQPCQVQAVVLRFREPI